MLVEQVARLSNERNGRLAKATGSITNDILDVATLRAFEKVESEDGSDFVIELIDLYLETTPPRIQAIRKAAFEKEWAVLKHIAHTIKGSSSTLGLHRVAQVCQELEATSLSSSDVVGGLVKALESRFVEAREALMAERKRRLQ
ncbi:MAG TPA: Hpt domain-containing protein [Pyrinomonadaceae bacterium]|jgi:HPt (histidine-containing phosphotransfer) domain-containing protein